MFSKNPEGLGVVCRVHADPFQTSARVCGLAWPKRPPTASHELTAVHETPLRASPGPPGVGCAVQVLPFHTAAPSPDGPPPTVSQKLAETQDTDSSGRNPGTVEPADHADPFQVFACPSPLTDMQKSTVAQDTACGSTSNPGL